MVYETNKPFWRVYYSTPIFYSAPAYPHYIENIGDKDLKIFMFFDQSNADDIGYKGGFWAYSREVLSATFQPRSINPIVESHRIRQSGKWRPSTVSNTH
jgi:oxalate decarboxylase/phosphoglucose isomerase-like protein (cupin superfamily)